MDKNMKRYSMLQLSADTHSILKEYCNENGYKMGKFVEKLILRECAPPVPKPKRVLRVHD